VLPEWPTFHGVVEQFEVVLGARVKSSLEVSLQSTFDADFLHDRSQLIFLTLTTNPQSQLVGVTLGQHTTNVLLNGYRLPHRSSSTAQLNNTTTTITRQFIGRRNATKVTTKGSSLAIFRPKGGWEEGGVGSHPHCLHRVAMICKITTEMTFPVLSI